MSTVNAPGAVEIGTTGTQSGSPLTVYVQPYCVTLVKGKDQNGVNMTVDQARALADLFLRAADVVQGVGDGA